MAKALLPYHTPEELAVLLSYDYLTGEIRVKVKYGYKNPGALLSTNTVSIQGHQYQLSRVAWCLAYGEWPPLHMYVDHADRNHSNNRFHNLRLATPSQNNFNQIGWGQYSRGVSYKPGKYPNRPWTAQIRINGTAIHLGNFETETEAAEAYVTAAQRFHGEFAVDKNCDG